MINLYNPNEYFKNIDISEIKQWAESSYGINFYEENQILSTERGRNMRPTPL